MDIFVGSIPFKFKEKDLEELFGQFGKVTSAKIIIDKASRQNKGFGFVEMPNFKEAKLAIDKLNNSEQEGRKIIVSEAKKDKDGKRIENAPPDWHKKNKKKDTIITYGDRK